MPIAFARCVSYLLSGLIAVLFASAAHAQTALGPVAGEVSFVSGLVRVESGGTGRVLGAGESVRQGDVLVTGASGHVHVRTVDKGLLALRPNSRAYVEIFEYDAAAPAETRIRLRLESGVMRTVSGEGAQRARDKFRLNTPVAAIGIRGTDFTVSTTRDLTRAVVSSGTIVVATIDGDCRVDSLGPCSGASSRSLSSVDAGKLLEVRLGQREPSLLDVRNGTSPDQLAPPLPSEPRANSDKGTAMRRQATSAVLETIIDAQIAPLRPPEPTLTWGRWAHIAGQPAGVDSDTFVAANGPTVAVNSLYLVSRSNSNQLRLPSAGQFEFRLQDAEAFLVDRLSQTAAAASVARATLSLDFGTSRFATSLQLTAGGNAFALRSQGQVLADGRMVGNLLYIDGSTNMAVRGALAGSVGERAAYLFDHSIDTRSAITGVTSWAR